MSAPPRCRLGIEMLSVSGMDPVSQVRLAAELGCGHVSLALGQVPAMFNPAGYPPWSLREDAALRRELVAVMHDTGVSISLGEGFAIRPGQAIADKAADMDVMAALGVRGLGAVGMEADPARSDDEFALFAQMAGERGLIATIEFAPGQIVSTIDEALALVRKVDRPHFRLLIDAMHFFRSGGSVAQVTALDPALIGYAQLCDVPLTPAVPDYMQEAMTMRRGPGSGELPLADFIAALPVDIPLGLEVPDFAHMQSGVAPIEQLRPAVAAARSLLN
jgi:sugar phosphate isomerase/epimerase